MLTNEQKSIVEAKDQNMVIVANAGTGKTHTIIEKLAYILEHEHIPSERILLTSFSRVASSELFEKASKKIGYQLAQKMLIGTIHSVCYKIIMENMKLLNIKAINIVGEGYLAAIALNRYPQLFKDKKEAVKYTAEFRKYLLKMEKNKNGNDPIYDALVEAQEILENDGKMLFDDLMIKTVKLFNKYPEIQKHWANKFDVIITDEAQDTNKIQWTILDLLSNDKTKRIIVGDVKQNIYAFRGCSYHYMDDFKKRTNAGVYTLSETFRFGKEFADISNKLINQLDIDEIYRKETKTNVDCHNKPVFNYISASAQPKYILDDIEKKLNQGFTYSDIHIIYRYNKEAIPFIKMFLANKIPFQTKSGDVFERIELKFVLKSYSLVKDFSLSDCIEFFAMYPNFIGDKTITSIYENNSDKIKNILDFIDHALKNKTEGIGYKKKESLQEMKTRFDALSSMINSELINFMAIARIMEMDQTKFMLKEIEDDANPSEDRYEFLLFFQENFDASEFKNPIDWFNDVNINGARIKEKSRNCVELKTIHGCKGQSLPVVYLIANRICDRTFIKTDSDIENEKFVFYVALTRAEKQMEIFIENPLAFKFNFILNENWQNDFNKISEEGIKSKEDDDIEQKDMTAYQLPSFIKETMKNNFKFKKSKYANVLNIMCEPVRHTDKAIHFKQENDLVWVPLSLIGYDNGRYYVEDWFIKKSNLYKFVDKF